MKASEWRVRTTTTITIQPLRSRTLSLTIPISSRPRLRTSKAPIKGQNQMVTSSNFQSPVPHDFAFTSTSGSVSRSPCCFSSRRPFCPTQWEDYRLGLQFFVHLHGSSNRSRRRSRRAAIGAMRTWIPYLRISAHGRHSTTLRIGFQMLRTSPRGNLHHQCSR